MAALTFFFSPLSANQALQFMENANGTVVEKLEIYMRWLHEFIWRVKSFNRHQYDRLRSAAEKYCDEKCVNRHDFDLAFERDEFGLKAYSNDIEKFEAELDNNFRRLFPAYYEARRDFMNLAEIALEYIRSTELQMKLGFYADNLSEIWFNQTINNTKDEQERLRRLPYDEYLRTDHWKKVRAALLLIKSAECECEKCNSSESWWGDEDCLHVHHKTYKNRGNERYNDLALLCVRGHAKIHGKEIAGNILV